MKRMRKRSFAKFIFLAMLVLMIVMIMAPTVMADLYSDGPLEGGEIRIFPDFWTMFFYLFGGKVFNPFV